MDELKINLTTKFTKSIVSKLIAMLIRKKVGSNIDVLINNLNVIANDGKIQIHADLDAEMTNEDLINLIKRIGLK